MNKNKIDISSFLISCTGLENMRIAPPTWQQWAVHNSPQEDEFFIEMLSTECLPHFQDQCHASKLVFSSACVTANKKKCMALFMAFNLGEFGASILSKLR